MTLDNDTAPNNVPKVSRKNVPNQQLGHIRHGQKNVKLNDVKKFVEERFDRWKEGTNFEKIKIKFDTDKSRAQRILKRGTQKGLFFTPLRKNPQQYFPESRHFEVIEYIYKENNVPKGTTGTRHLKNPLSSCLEYQKANNFLDIMVNLPFRPLEMHKIQVELSLDKECYELIKTCPWKGNLGREVSEVIDNIEVKYDYYKNGNVIIHLASSNRPFRLETEEALAILFSFLGQVRDRLEYHISDPRGRIVPNITQWILKQCDFNKDVPITDKAQITLPDIQLSTAFQTFRLYVNNLGGKAYDRCEASLNINQPLVTYLNSTINPFVEIFSKLELMSKQINAIAEKLDYYQRINAI